MSQILYDRSRVEADWRCPRYRYLAYEYDGKGITSDTDQLELFLGKKVHDGLARIAKGVNIDVVAETAAQQVRTALLVKTEGEPEAEAFACEQAALVEGQLRGFHRWVWPRLQQQYPTIVAIEEEMTYEHAGLLFMSRPDLIVEDTDGNLWYVEYKTTSSKTEAWINQWSTAVQLHSCVRAATATLERVVVGVIVLGLYKGYVAYGKQTSPFCYVYMKQGNPPFTKDEVSYEYKAGLKKHPTWLRDGGVKKWIAEMPEKVLSEQFLQVPPIFLNESLIDTFFRERVCRERNIVDGNQRLAEHPSSSHYIMEEVFPHRFNQCNPSFGHPCMFKQICHGNVENPLEHGYIYRTPHHQLEVDKFNAET